LNDYHSNDINYIGSTRENTSDGTRILYSEHDIRHNANTASADSHYRNGPSEAKFVAVRIGQVKELFAPFGIARCRVCSVAGRDHARIEGVDLGMVEDDTSLPGPLSRCRLCDEIEKAGSSPKACKRGVIATMNDLKSQHAIEGDRA